MKELKRRQTFQEFLSRTSAYQELERICENKYGNVMVFGGKEFIIDESSIEQSSLEGIAVNRDDAGKIMKYLRKKGISAARDGACGIVISI